MKRLAIGLALALIFHGVAGGALVLEGFLNTPAGLYSGDDGWSHAEGGYRVDWTVTRNGSTWHYEYAFSRADGSVLNRQTSHFIISLSDNILEEDLFNFTGDIAPVDPTELGTFGPAAGNPGFPVGESIFGIKINLGGDHAVVVFDSTRAPMWGDFYAKDGKSGTLWNYAYNMDLGVEAVNANDYWAAPVDGDGRELYKVLVPDTIPEPATLGLLGLGGLLLGKRRRA